MEGPSGRSVAVRLALDTASTGTILSVNAVVTAGYDLANATTQTQLTTASGVQRVSRLTMTKFTALGKSRANFSVVAYTLPAGSGVDGLLGLDFLRGGILAIDFRTGQITFT